MIDWIKMRVKKTRAKKAGTKKAGTKKAEEQKTEPDMDNLPAGVIDWDELSDFIEDMLKADSHCGKGWMIIKDDTMTESIKANSLEVLNTLYDDLYGFFYTQRDDRNEVWQRMERFIRTKYSGLSDKALSRIISTYHIDDR